MAELPAELLRRLGALQVSVRNASKQFQPTDLERRTLLADIDADWQSRPDLFFVRLLILRDVGAIDAFLALQPASWVCAEQEAAFQVLIQCDDSVLLRRFLTRGVLTSSIYLVEQVANVGDATFYVILDFLPKLNIDVIDNVAITVVARQRTDLLALWLQATRHVGTEADIAQVLSRIRYGYAIENPRLTAKNYQDLLNISRSSPEKAMEEQELISIAFMHDSPLFYYYFAKVFGIETAEKALDRMIYDLFDETGESALLRPSKVDRILYWLPGVRAILESARREAAGETVVNGYGDRIRHDDTEY